MPGSSLIVLASFGTLAQPRIGHLRWLGDCRLRFLLPRGYRIFDTSRIAAASTHEATGAMCYRRPIILFSAVPLVFALLVVGCGKGSKSPPLASVASPATRHRNTALDYAPCMRSNGVPTYPDPDSNGNVRKGDARAFGVSSSQYQAAEQECQHLLPNAGATSLTQCLMTGDCPRSVVQPALEEGRKFAECMRSRGVPNWPDPTVDSTGRPSFQVTKAGITIDATRSPQMLSKIGACQRQPGAVLLRQE